MTASIRVNGKDEMLTAATVAELLQARGIVRPRGVAVALNGTVVPGRPVARARGLPPATGSRSSRPFGGG